MDMFSLDTDIFILYLRRYPEFPRETIFVTGTGNRQRKIQLKPGNTQSLHGLPSFSGADTVKEICLFGKHLWIVIGIS